MGGTAGPAGASPCPMQPTTASVGGKPGQASTACEGAQGKASIPRRTRVPQLGDGLKLELAEAGAAVAVGQHVRPRLVGGRGKEAVVVGCGYGIRSWLQQGQEGDPVLQPC